MQLIKLLPVVRIQVIYFTVDYLAEVGVRDKPCAQRSYWRGLAMCERASVREGALVAFKNSPVARSGLFDRGRG